MTGKPTFNHDALKQLSNDLGRPVSTLIALASRNDPFFIGPRRQTEAEWFARLWKKLKIGHGAHVRRIHYLLVSQKKPVLFRDAIRKYGGELEATFGRLQRRPLSQTGTRQLRRPSQRRGDCLRSREYRALVRLHRRQRDRGHARAARAAERAV